MLFILQAEVDAAWELRNKIVAEVAAGNMTVVCDGVTSEILPGLDDSKVPGFYTVPYGPHAIGNFKAWTPREYFGNQLNYLSFYQSS
jgi:hypothetical protein